MFWFRYCNVLSVSLKKQKDQWPYCKSVVYETEMKWLHGRVQWLQRRKPKWKDEAVTYILELLNNLYFLRKVNQRGFIWKQFSYSIIRHLETHELYCPFHLLWFFIVFWLTHFQPMHRLYTPWKPPVVWCFLGV